MEERAEIRGERIYTVGSLPEERNRDSQAQAQPELLGRHLRAASVSPCLQCTEYRLD